MNGEPAPRDPCRRTSCARSSATTPNGSCTSTRCPRGGRRTASGRSGSTRRSSAALLASGIEAPWSHQVEVGAGRPRRAARRRQHGTASGKSLGYHLPMLSDLVAGAAAPNGRGATALYLSPTKALAADQLSRIDRLALPGGARRRPTTATPRPTSGAGSATTPTSCSPTPTCSTTPCCPGTSGGARSCARCATSSSTSATSTRASSGRTWRRCCAGCGGSPPATAPSPTFVFASATVADPEEHASRLLGMPVTAGDRDGSPRASMTFALWEPPRCLVDETGAAAARQHHHRDGRAARRVRARAACRPWPSRGRGPGSRSWRAIAEGAVPVDRRAAGVAAYRGGYLPEERRELERALRVEGAARPRGDERPRARRRRQRPRRRAARRLAGHAVVAVAAGRAGRPVRRALARRARRRRRPARHLRRAPPRGDLRPRHRGDRRRPRQPARARRRTSPRRPPSCR